MNNQLKLVECPRDAMQGFSHFIDTSVKISYINKLLKCGFDTIDFGSFVSPKAIPQLKDTVEVLNGLDLESASSKLLAIVANERGAKDALEHSFIDVLGFPLSLSETFQQRNTNASIEEAWKILGVIHERVAARNKSMVVYLSMGFGNPYEDRWNVELLFEFSRNLYEKLGITTIALSDTIGAASPILTNQVFQSIIPALPHVEFGAHMHVNPMNSDGIIAAAFEGGCRRFDSAIRGFGGCPMAKDELVGNLPTEKLIEWLNRSEIQHTISSSAFQEAFEMSQSVFS
jgi:hydroxymethylglutaryl-CoA lyase